MNTPNNKSIEELRIQNEALEQSPEYQRILPEVMKEVYTIFVNERIKAEEVFLESVNEDDPFFLQPFIPDDLPFVSPLDELSIIDAAKMKISQAKELMPHNPEMAAQIFMQLGSCHTLWSLQKTILKEKYGITWYSPSDLNPDIKYD